MKPLSLSAGPRNLFLFLPPPFLQCFCTQAGVCYRWYRSAPEQGAVHGDTTVFLWLITNLSVEKSGFKSQFWDKSWKRIKAIKVWIISKPRSELLNLLYLFRDQQEKITSCWHLNSNWLTRSLSKRGYLPNSPPNRERFVFMDLLLSEFLSQISLQLHPENTSVFQSWFGTKE